MCIGFAENQEWPGVIGIGCLNYYMYPEMCHCKNDASLRDICRITSHETIHGVLDQIGEEEASFLIDLPPFYGGWYCNSGLPGKINILENKKVR